MMKLAMFGFTGSGGGGGGGTIGGSGTLNYVAKFTPDGTTIGNSLIFDTGSAAGVNTTTPLTLWEVSANNSLAILVSTVYSDNASISGGFFSRRARGNSSSPAQVIVDNLLGGFGSGGYTNAGSFSSSVAAVKIFAAESYTAIANGGYLTIETTPVGSTVALERARFTHDGFLGLGISSSIASRLHIKGSGNTSSTYSLIIDSSTVSNLAVVRDDGFIGFGVNSAIVNGLSRFSFRNGVLWAEFMDGVDVNTGLIIRKDENIASVVRIGTRNGQNNEDPSKVANIYFDNANGYMSFGGYPYANQKFIFNLNYIGSNAQESFNISCGLHSIDTGPRLVFSGAPNSASNNQFNYGAINIFKENAVDTEYTAYMAFLTSDGATLTEAMRITSSQNICFGTTLEPSLVTNAGDFETIDANRGYIVLDKSDGLRYRIFTNNGVVSSEVVV